MFSKYTPVINPVAFTEKEIGSCGFQINFYLQSHYYYQSK